MNKNKYYFPKDQQSNKLQFNIIDNMILYYSYVNIDVMLHKKNSSHLLNFFWQSVSDEISESVQIQLYIYNYMYKKGGTKKNFSV